ncbi:MlaD family protein [Nitrosophilus labii]|uniref:MlaD family protein n=1 Tax=Nitrosophilus labii TaxID=2706014 RepID=UPI001657558F|nr:MlaD family protein [Nitrosophilus labii]
MKTEAKVGIFVTLGLVFLFLLSTQVSKFANLGKDGYIIYAYLEDVNGLERNVKVKIKGVEVGYVEDIVLEGDKVKTKLFLFKGVKVPKDSVVQINQESMLGTKYLSIIPGKTKDYLEANGYIEKQRILPTFDETAQSIDDAAKEFKEFIKELREDMKGDRGDDLKKSVANLRDITESIKKLIEENRQNISDSIVNLNNMAKELASAGKKFGEMSSKFSYTADSINSKLPDIMKKIDKLANDLSQVGKKAKEKLPEILDRFSSLEKDLEEIIKDNKEPLNKAINSADYFFTTGGDTFKKVDSYLEKVANSQIEIAFRSEYMANDAYTKNYASIYYIPTPNKYYMLDVVSGDDYSRLDNSGNVIEPQTHEDFKLLVSAQYGRRYNDFLFRLGIIENTGGVGVDYFMFTDRAKVSLEAYDFNAVNDVRGTNPHLKLLARYRFLKHLDTFVGVDNFLNSEATNFIFGLGFDFIDNDLKSILGAASGAGTFIK